MTYPRRLLKMLLLTALVVLELGWAGRPQRQAVGAQAGPQVRVNPAESVIPVGGLTSVTLEVLGGVEVNAFDLKMTYDPAVLTLEAVTPGTYLSNLAEVKKQIEPGLIRLVYTQLATAAVSGDGPLLQLSFRGAAEGSAAIVLEALQLAGPSGGLVEPELVCGVVHVAGAAPTETPTQAPTQTPEPTRTPDPTRTPTRLPATPVFSRTPTAAWASPTATRRLPTASMTHATTPLPAGSATAPVAVSLPLLQSSPTDSAKPGKNASGLEDLPVTGASHPAQSDPPQAADASGPAGALPTQALEQVLWGVLIGCLGLFLLMLLALFRRRKKKQLLNKEGS